MGNKMGKKSFFYYLSRIRFLLASLGSAAVLWGPLPVWHVLKRFCSPCVWICQISATPVLWVAKAYWRAQGWGKGMRWTDRGDRPTPNQCNQTSYQSAIQSEGSPGQRRVGGRKRREDGCLLAFRSPRTSTFLCAPPSPQRWLWWVQPPPPALFKSTAPRGTSRRSPGPLLSQTAKAAPPEPRGLNSQTHR